MNFSTVSILPLICLINISIYRVAGIWPRLQCGLVSGHFLFRSQGDSIRQRHGDGCRVPVSHHLFINLKSFTYNSISEDADVFFSLYDSREAKQIRYTEEPQRAHNSLEWAYSKVQTVSVQEHKHTCTSTHSLCPADWGILWLSNTLKLWFGFVCSEKFMVKLNKNGGPKNPEKVDRLCALFTVRYLYFFLLFCSFLNLLTFVFLPLCRT